MNPEFGKYQLKYHLKKKFKGQKVAQHVKALATKNDNLRLISEIHMVK